MTYNVFGGTLSLTQSINQSYIEPLLSSKQILRIMCACMGTAFLTYLLRPVPSDVQLFIQAVHHDVFRVDSVGQLSRDG